MNNTKRISRSVGLLSGVSVIALGASTFLSFAGSPTVYDSGAHSHAAFATYDANHNTSSSYIVTGAGTSVTSVYTNGDDNNTALPQGVIHIGNGAVAGDTEAFMRIENGASVAAQQSLRIGSVSGVDSWVSVSGAGSSLQSPQIFVGYSAAGGTNSLNIVEGGRVSAHDVYAALRSDGTINVAGVGSQLNITRGSNAAGNRFGQLTVGVAGKAGTLNVGDGGQVNLGKNTLLSIGGTGYEKVANIIDSNGAGTVNINANGTVNADMVAVGNSYDRSTAVLNVSGAHAALNAATLYVSTDDGTGRASVGHGGSVNLTKGMILSTGKSGKGEFYLNDGGVLTVGGSDGIMSGNSAGGYAFVMNGGTLKAANSDLTTSVNMTLADASTSTIDSNGLNTTLAGNLSGGGGLIKNGSGVLTLGGINTFRGGLTLNKGKIIANGQYALPDDIAYMINDGTLETKGFTVKVSSLSGKGGAIDLSSQGQFNVDQNIDTVYAGSIRGGSDSVLNKAGRGVLVLNADSPDFTGQVDVKAGGLDVNGNISNASLRVQSDAVLSGGGQVGDLAVAKNASLVVGSRTDKTLASAMTTKNLTNEGSITFLHQGLNATGLLTVDGDYRAQGSGALVQFNTRLGDDNSPTDFLHITGNASGMTGVQVVNRNGLGALTTGNGFQLIQVDGTSDKSNFALQSDYSFEGRAAVIGGAYAYSLYAGDQADNFAGDWYLRSLYMGPDDTTRTELPVKPVYAATVPLYEVYPQILQQLNKPGTLEQRVGNRTWLGTAKDARAARMNEAEGYGFWMKVDGSTGHINPDISKTRSNYDLDIMKTLLGVDFGIADNDNGKLIGGVYFQYGHARADVSSRFGKGNIKTDGYGLGGTLTWYGANDVYVDGVAQFMWYDSDIHSLWVNKGHGAGLVNGNDGTGYALSIETGKKIALNQNWTMTPQAQLSYNSVDFDSFHTNYNAHVSREDGDALTGRLGMALNRETAWKSQQGDMRRFKTYGIGNLYYEFLNGTEVSVTQVDFRNRSDRFWGGLGGGLSYNWKDDAYSIYGEVDTRTPFADFGHSYSLNGTIGFKAKF